MPPSKEFSVQRISELARIDVSNDQIEKIQNELNNVLELIEVLDELKLEDVAPFFGMTSESSESDTPVQPLRQDTVTSSLAREDVLKNSPKNDGEFYCVPPVFD